jgi:surface antigen
MQAESALNPGRWQSEAVGSSSAGYGLIQWTGSSIHTRWSGLNGRDYSTMDANLDHILAEANSNDSWYRKRPELRDLMETYPELNFNKSLDLTYSTFTKSTDSPYNLACIFVFYRERCHDSLYGSRATRKALCDKRGGYAQEWYTFLGGTGFNFGGGGIPFPARTTEEQKTKFIKDLINNTEDYIKSFYRNHAGYYSGRYGIPNNSKVDGLGGNCTAYAYGRFWELADCAKSITGKTSKPTSALHGDAGSWFPNNETKNDYSYGFEPKKGAVLCFAKEGGAGHVAIVEDIKETDEGTEILCSESGWKSPILFYQTRKRPKGAAADAKTNWSDKYQFQGFIYQHYDFDNCPGGYGYGAPQIKSIILTRVNAETIEGQGFLATDGVTSITCEITGKSLKNDEEVSVEGVELKSLDNTDTGSEDSSEESSPANNLTIKIDGTQKSFNFQITGLVPLATYDITFSAGGGSFVVETPEEAPEETTEETE